MPCPSRVEDPFQESSYGELGCRKVETRVLFSFPGRADICVDGEEEGAETGIPGALHRALSITTVPPHVELEP